MTFLEFIENRELHGNFIIYLNFAIILYCPYEMKIINILVYSIISNLKFYIMKLIKIDCVSYKSISRVKQKKLIIFSYKKRKESNIKFSF